MTKTEAAGATVVNAMSIDVEDYFHVSVFDGILPRAHWERMESRVEANTTRLLDIFDEFSVRSTFFVLGWVAERHPELVRALACRGHEIASHGYAHRLVYDQTPTAFRADVRRAKQLLEDASGRRVIGYRAPSYSITPRSLWALDVLLEEGYEYDSSIFPIRHDRYGIPLSGRRPYAIERSAGTLVEVPGSTTRLGPVESAGCRRGVLSHSAVLVDALGYRPGQSPGRPSGRVLSASLGNRPGAAEVTGGHALGSFDITEICARRNLGSGNCSPISGSRP